MHLKKGLASRAASEKEGEEPFLDSKASSTRHNVLISGLPGGTLPGRSRSRVYRGRADLGGRKVVPPEGKRGTLVVSINWKKTGEGGCLMHRVGRKVSPRSRLLMGIIFHVRGGAVHATGQGASRKKRIVSVIWSASMKGFLPSNHKGMAAGFGLSGYHQAKEEQEASDFT